MTSGRETAECQSEKSLADCMRYMLDNEISTDVSLEVGPPDGDTVTFRAHKCVLMSRSEVFAGMFSSGMTECRSGSEAKVRIEDIDADVFKELLNYMYSERASIYPESAVHLMYAAKKYMLPKLVRVCGKCISDGLSVNNVTHFLEQSLRFGHQELESDCLKLISTNAKAVFSGKENSVASREVMEAILEAKSMSVNESVIYEAAVDWAKGRLKHAIQEENPTDLQIREALGDLLYKIRFPAMGQIEFAEIGLGNNVLTAEEKESIYYFLATKKKDSQLKFPTERRILEDIWINRAETLECCNFTATKDFDAINFKTDKGILLTGIGLYKGYREKGYDVDVEILQAATSMSKKRVTVPHRLTGDRTQKVLFDEPIVINPGVVYSVKTMAYESIGYDALSCKETCTKDNVTFTFSNHSESKYTTVSGGQIPRLYFCVL